MTISTISPELAANSLLKKLSIKSPNDLRDLEVLAYYRGALVRYGSLSGSEARLSVVGTKAIITISDKALNPHRQRFSIAHELGHLEMHRTDSGVAICTERDLNEWGRKTRNAEQEANIFAAAFLLPKSFFEPLCDEEDPSLDFISQLAQRFQASLTATALRYIKFCPEPIAVVYSQEGRIRWASRSSSFQELNVYIERNVRLDPLSNASRVASNIRHQSAKRVPASAWFAKGKHFDDALITEHSWYMAWNDAILTLLWVDDDIKEDDDFMWNSR